MYDRVVAKPITLRGEGKDSANGNESEVKDDAKGKRIAYFKERQEILQDAEIKKRRISPSYITALNEGGEEESFFLIEHSFSLRQHVAPLFKVVYLSLMKAFVFTINQVSDYIFHSILLLIRAWKKQANRDGANGDQLFRWIVWRNSNCWTFWFEGWGSIDW